MTVVSSLRVYGSRAGLERAQRNVAEQYAVVGLLEEWAATLAVLEALVPRFFANATAKYFGQDAGRRLQLM